MEEQKKNNGDAPKHKNRRHGYFMQPPANGASAPATIRPHNEERPQKADAAKHDAPQKERRDGDSPERRDNRDRKKHDRRPQNQAQKQERPQIKEGGEQNQNKENKQPTAVPKSGEHTPHPSNQGAHKKHRNHHAKKGNRTQTRPEDKAAEPKDNNQKTETATASQPKAQQQKPQQPKRESDRRRTSGSQLIQRPTPDHSADDYEEYKLIVEDDTTTSNKDSENGEGEGAQKTEIVGVRFKSTGKVYYFDPADKRFTKGMGVIVDTARGQEYGEIAMANSFVNTADLVSPLRQVIRAATVADTEHHKENKKKEEEAFKVCCEKITAHGLDMKLIDAQYTFDNSKLLFYFTSSDRVDFRNLVKDLASVFRTRIELRQIGIRDEAKIMGGLGICGRPLCCTLFLSDFDQVSIKMAKEQNLSLNSAKISGICGRLMCCLRYEHEAYEYEIKRTPPVDSLVRTENGDGIVTEISPLQGTIKVRLLASPEIPPKTYKRDDVTMLRKKQK